MKVLLGMSGGVDSTYSAYKLKSMGYEVEGAVIKMHKHTETEEACAAAEAIGIPCHIIDAQERFQSIVISDFISEYRKGRTPNPCVVCNSEVKFRLLYDYAIKHGFDKIATGHYADIVKFDTDTGVCYALKRSEDDKKDQTYMLWRLSQDILSRLVLPLAKEQKKDVRSASHLLELSCADRGDSQEICFIPDGDYAAYIEERAGKSPDGNFIDKHGNILGRHKGIIRYTIGQRKGLGISLGKRAFISKINVEDNTITLDTEDTFSSSFTVSDLSLIGLSSLNIGDSLTLDVKHRYLAPLTHARVTFIEENCALVEFSEPVRAVTSGQSCVFYKDGILMGGGIIN